MSSGRVFISYSRRDQPAVTRIAAELDQLGQEVWLDQELSGGQRWWDAILERIRGCDCFIFALSEASVNSRACRAELEYAHQLGRSILPVAVGPAVPDQLLPPVLAETQRVNTEAPMQLARALLSLPATPPLPDPLPVPPLVPVSYLDQLSDAVNRQHLTVAEQRDLLGSIKQRLRDPEERTAAIALLQRFRRHGDINAWVAEEIDAELAKLGPPPSSLPPPQPPQPPPHYPPPQHPPPRTWVPPRQTPAPPVRAKSRVGWWIAAAIGLVLLLGFGACVVVIGASVDDVNDDVAQLRDECDGGDMAACDDLFFRSPEASDDEFFGATCGERTVGEFAGFCEENLGGVVP